MAREVSETMEPSVRGGLDMYLRQNSSLDREGRISTDFGLTWPLNDRWRIDQFVLISPDVKDRSGRVNVSENLYLYLPTVTWAYPWMFRYTLSVGPAFVYSRTIIEFDDDSEIHKHLQMAWHYKIGFDYAIAACCELSSTIGFIKRHEDEKMDWYYGLSYAQNLPYWH